MQGAAARGLHKFHRGKWLDERDLMPTCINSVVVVKRGI